MALNINGTTGISGVDGSASAPALTGTDANTGINFGSDVIDLSTGGSSRFKVGAAGQLGIAGANYGTAGQALLSQGASAAPQWGAVSSSSPTETYALVNLGTTYDANSGYVTQDIGSGSGNNMTIDTTNNKVTPTVAGNYLVIYMCIWLWSFSGGATWYNRITKNGSEQQRSQFSAYDPGSYNNTTISIISMDGSSDYFQFEGYENKSGQTAYMGNLSRATMFLLKES